MPELEPGSMVVLNSLPPGLLLGLPDEDQVAIRSIVGHPVVFAGYSWGAAEIEFVDFAGIVIVFGFSHLFSSQLNAANTRTSPGSAVRPWPAPSRP